MIHRMTVREEPQEGHDALATSELLARVTGAKLESMEALLNENGGLRNVMARAPQFLKGTQLAKLRAVVTLAPRFVVSPDDRAPLRSPKDAWTYFAPRMESLEVEEFHVAILDSQHKVKRSSMVTRGVLNSSMVHPREVFALAITERAAAILLCHNHPSGDPTPSADDRAITAQLVAAGRLLDIPVADHIIIGRGRYKSFAEEGLL
jgi:DNA repair protein RadC